MTVLLLLAGFVTLIVGGEVLVRGAKGLGVLVRISPIVIGMTVVAFATSAPELAVTISAQLAGSPGLVIGNVVGSNVANVLLVLGATALILPITVSSVLVKREIPLLVLAGVLLLVLSLDGDLTRIDGAILFLGLVAFVTFSVISARRSPESQASQSDPPEDTPEGRVHPRSRSKALILDLLALVAGIGLLVVGARWLVDAATEIAIAVGLSDLVIGLTIVAIGTSLPELATSVIAALRGERELAIGNIVGSNLFNIGAVLGIAGLIGAEPIAVLPGAITFDLPIMVLVSLALLPVAFTGFRISRREGVLFLAYYAAYIAYLLLDAANHDALPALSTVLLAFAFPITGLTFALLVGHQIRTRRKDREQRRTADTADTA